MRKLIVGLLAFLLSGFVAVPSHADGRIDLSLNRSQALSGTEISFNGLHAVGEGYDWSLYRYEVVRHGGPKAELSIKVRQESAVGFCPGTATNIDATNRVCSFSSDAQTVVADAASALSTREGVQQQTMSITTVVSSVVVYGVRAWLDLNDNGKREAYEPSSREKRVEFLPVVQGKGLLEFVFEPPTVNEEYLSAWVYGGGTVSGIVDPNLLSYEVYEITPDGRQQASGSLKINSHPQIQAHQLLALNLNLRYPARYVAEIWYQVAAGNKVMLASETYNFESIGAAEVKTSVSTTTGFASISKDSATPGIIVGPETSEVTYLLEAKDFEGKPLVGQDVYFYIDSFDLPTASSLRVNQGFLIPRPNTFDQTILKRKTDARGRVELTFSSSEKRVLGEITIDFRLNGFGAYGWGEDSSKQRIVWSEPAPLIETFSAMQPQELKGRELDVSFNIRVPGQDELLETYTVLAVADGPIEISQPLLTGVGKDSTKLFKIRLSRLATDSGSSLLTARLVTKYGQEVEGYWRIDWDSKDFSLRATPISKAPLPVVKLTSIARLNDGQLLVVQGEVLNGFGTRVNGDNVDYKVRVSIQEGSNLQSQGVASVDADGQFKTYLPASSFDFKVQAELALADQVLHELSCTDLSAEPVCATLRPQPESLKSWAMRLDSESAKIYAKNIIGSGKIQFMLNGKEIAWANATSNLDKKLHMVGEDNYLVRTVNLTKGKNVLEVFVNGERTTRTVYSR